MPELPEVEAARTLIADRALHRPVVDVDDSDSYVRRPHPPGELRNALLGRQLTAAHRRGKTIWLETSGTSSPPAPGGPELGIHLGMTGRIVVTAPDGTVAEAGDPPRYHARKAEWDRFALTFADGGSLVLLDPRRLGRVRLNPDIGALGPDALQVTPAQFGAIIKTGTIAVKPRLLDQSKIAGVGNLLADEILWQARVSPRARVDSLSAAQVTRLYRALKFVLESAVTKGGAHTGDMIAASARGTAPRWHRGSSAAGPPGGAHASRRSRRARRQSPPQREIAPA